MRCRKAGEGGLGQLDLLDVEGVLALRSTSERCAERIEDAARILEAQNEILYAEERANTKPCENRGTKPEPETVL